MIYLKKANLEDAEKEYELTQKTPANENGVENKAYGVSYDEFVTEIIPKWIDSDKGINLEEGRVPDTYYFLWVDDTPVGIFKLRHYLNDWLRENAGHVGYSIAEEYRGHGYATEGLRLIMEEARKLPIDTDELYLSALKTNTASLKVQQKNGAKIVREDDEHYYTRIPL
jgi:Predicted acetyltransferase